MKKIILCALILVQAASNTSFSQNILPNYGFERDNALIGNTKCSDGTLTFWCTDRYVLDSCEIISCNYYNEIRTKGHLTENLDLNRWLLIPYRGKSFLEIMVGSIIVFKLNEKIKKDSIYYYESYMFFDFDSLYANFVDLAYTDVLPKTHKELVALTNRFSDLKKTKVCKNEYFYVKNTGSFKAKSDAKYFMVFIDERATKIIKERSMSIKIDNVSLEKTRDTANIGVFKIEKLQPVLKVESVFLLNDIAYESSKIEKITEIVRKKDYLIMIEYTSNVLGMQRKDILADFLKQKKYDKKRIYFKEVAEKTLKNNVNILFY
ncbi:MAG: hypothetical protein WCK02_10310 [Bacteroidota bacterium]